MRKFVKIIAVAALLFLFSPPVQSRAGKINGTVEAQGLRSPKNVLVYLAKGPPLPAGLTSPKFMMDQRNLTFIPHILPVLVGSTVDFLLEITNPGDWMMHCHIAEHLHAGMMLSFHVDE